MKWGLFIFTLISFALTGCTNAQNKEPDNGFEYTFKTAHPAAQALMKEDFYWSAIEETGPFGSDDGWDASQQFREWRLMHRSASPLVFLKQLIKKWQYPYFDWNEMDTTKIKTYITSRADIDEASVEQQLKQFKEAIKNIPDTSMHPATDNELRKIIRETAAEIGGDFLLGQDNAIIATGFAQFALEGKMDTDINTLTAIAIKRQLLPVLIDRYEIPYRDKRREQLTKILTVVNQVNK